MSRTPRPELMALLADVKENPDDLTPWLVLCDWLEDRDDEAERARGEYCRLCFDKLGTKTYASDWEKGERRRHLYRTYHDAWLGPISLLTPQVQKGLLRIQNYNSSLEDILWIASNDEEQWAWVGYLVIYPPVADFTAEGLAPVFSGLHTLVLENPMTVKTVIDLTRCPLLAHLRELSISLHALSEATANRLAASPHLAGLVRFQVRIHGTWQQIERATQYEVSPEAEAILHRRFGDGLEFRRR